MLSTRAVTTGDVPQSAAHAAVRFALPFGPAVLERSVQQRRAVRRLLIEVGVLQGDGPVAEAFLIVRQARVCIATLVNTSQRARKQDASRVGYVQLSCCSFSFNAVITAPTVPQKVTPRARRSPNPPAISFERE